MIGLISIPVHELRKTDVVIRLDDNGRMRDSTSFKYEIPTLGCPGRHFLTDGNQLVCYVPGKVLIRPRNG